MTSIFYTKVFTQNDEILPNKGIKIKTTQTTMGLFGSGSSSTGRHSNKTGQQLALRIYSPMSGLIFTGSPFLDINKDAIQLRKVSTFPNFIKEVWHKATSKYR